MTSFSTTLGPEHRADSIRRMRAGSFDVAIVGGGVTGCGAALDAATRGLSVALIEQRDWAAGTSSRSSKLIHGGLRYLEQGEIGLVREARHEQTLMLDRLCPHLVRPVSFLLPLDPRPTRRLWQRPYYGAGILLYEWLSGKRVLPRHRHHTRKSALARFPWLRSDALAGAIEYYDALVDDARHTLCLARTAAAHGTALATSVRAEGFVDTGSGIAGVKARCLETGERFEIAARRIVNATGVWTDKIQDMAGRGRIHVRASKGIHLVVPRDRIPGEAGLVLRTAQSVLFVIPWQQHWIIGTTDSDWELDLSHPAASARDVGYLLETVNAVLARPLTKADIEGVYAGLRPLLSGEEDATSRLSREHAVSESVSGLITVAGGKYTTYRIMARDTLDLVARELPTRVPRSCTHEIPLLGAEGFEAAWNRREVTASETGPPRGDGQRDRAPPQPGRAPAIALRRAGLGAARAGGRQPRALASARGGAGLHRSGGRLRRIPRGGAAPRGRTDPTHADLDRDLRPRPPGCAPCSVAKKTPPAGCLANTPYRNRCRA